MRRRPNPAPGGNGAGLRVCAVAIGLLAVVAQSVRSQEGTAGGTGGPGWITSRDVRWRERFQGLLLATSRDLAAGWQLARDVGRPAVPLLWDMVDDERSDVGRRLVVLAAAMLAGGSHEDERLFAWLDQQKPMLEERTLVAMTLALGPRRPRPVPDFWSRSFGPAKTPELLLAIAVRLASARVPESEEGAPGMNGDDPGLAAATAYAGLPLPASVSNRWWNLKAPERHAELFWRGSLLGASRRSAPSQDTDGLLERASHVMALDGEAMALARAAATLYRARNHDLRPAGTRLDPRLLLVASSDLTTAAALHPWLGPVAQPRDDEPQRLAVAYALSRAIDVVVADREVWRADPRINRHIATALAWRVLGAPAGAPIEAVVPGLAEWNFVRWASGAAIDRTVTCDDPQLQTALDLIADGRMPRSALREALEEALWRWGSHPGLAPWEHERLLVRDLLLSGSNPGGGKYQAHVRPDLRYSPTGLDRRDGFFVVAVALYEFMIRPRAPLPREHRLPP